MMPMTEGDWAYEQYIVEQEFEELKKFSVEEFRKERLQSFYLNHPLLAKPALEALAEARSLAASSPKAALVLSAIAMELGYKDALVKPVVFGLVHAEVPARLIADLVMAHSALDRFHGILSQILFDYAGVELSTFRRPGVQITLWEEMKSVQRLRNEVMHRGIPISTEESHHAIEVASAILETVFPTVIVNLGLQLGNSTEVQRGAVSEGDEN